MYIVFRGNLLCKGQASINGRPVQEVIQMHDMHGYVISSTCVKVFTLHVGYNKIMLASLRMTRVACQYS